MSLTVTAEPERDEQVRIAVYQHTMNAGMPPSVAELASSLRFAESDVVQSLRRLADGRVLVLQPHSAEILMAPPWSAVPTPFVVRLKNATAYGNCAWDALGVLAALHEDGEIVTSCADCGEGASVHVRDGNVQGEGLVHFALPVRQWWKNVVFT